MKVVELIWKIYLHEAEDILKSALRLEPLLGC